MSVGVRVFIGIVLIQVASAALILGWYFYSLQSDLRELTRQNAQQAVLRSIESTEDYFLPAEAVVQAGRLLLADDVLGRDRPDQLERYFLEQLRLRPQIAGLYVGYPDGGFFYVMRSDEEVMGGTRTKVIRQGPQGREVELTWRDPDHAKVKAARDPDDPYDPRERAWYRAAVEGQTSVWTKPYVFFTSRKPGITLASTVAKADGTIAAVLGVDIELSEISSFLMRNGLGMGGSAYIATSEGEVIAHSNAEFVTPSSTAAGDSLRFRKVSELSGIEGAIGEGILARFSDEPSANPVNVWEEESNGLAYIVAMGQMSNVSWPWQIIAIVPQTRQSDVGRAGNLILIAVIFLATALACLVGYFVSRSIGRPLAVLRRNAMLARNGNIELMAKLATGCKEIDETADSLYDLAARQRREGPPLKAAPPAKGQTETD